MRDEGLDTWRSSQRQDPMGFMGGVDGSIRSWSDKNNARFFIRRRLVRPERPVEQVTVVEAKPRSKHITRFIAGIVSAFVLSVMILVILGMIRRRRRNMRKREIYKDIMMKKGSNTRQHQQQEKAAIPIHVVAENSARVTATLSTSPSSSAPRDSMVSAMTVSMQSRDGSLPSSVVINSESIVKASLQQQEDDVQVVVVEQCVKQSIVDINDVESKRQQPELSACTKSMTGSDSENETNRAEIVSTILNDNSEQSKPRCPRPQASADRDVGDGGVDATTGKDVPARGEQIEACALCDVWTWIQKQNISSHNRVNSKGSNTSKSSSSKNGEDKAATAGETKQSALEKKKNAYMQHMLNCMVTIVQQNKVQGNDAALIIHECAALLGFALAKPLPHPTIILWGMPKSTSMEQVMSVMKEFGKIDTVAIASGQRGFALVRYQFPMMSVDLALQKYRGTGTAGMNGSSNNNNKNKNNKNSPSRTSSGYTSSGYMSGHDSSDSAVSGGIGIIIEDVSVQMMVLMPNGDVIK